MNSEDFDIVTVGSITLDLFVEMDEMEMFSQGEHRYFGFEVGQKIRMKTIEKQVGGGGANSAVGFSKMGFKTTCMGTVGDGDNGDFILHNLKKKGICTDCINIQKSCPSSVSIVVMNPSGERTIFNEKTCHTSFSKLPNAKALYCGHLSLDESEIFPEIFKWKQKNPEKIFAWNPGKTQFKQGIQHHKDILSVTDLLILNIEEAELFTKINAQKVPMDSYPIECIAFPENKPTQVFDSRGIASVFLENGVKRVVITDGKRGAQFFSQEKSLFMPIADMIPPVHTLGAGDAFSVGAVTLLLENKTPEEIMLGGAFNANSVVKYFGAQAGILDHDELLKSITL